MLYNKEAEVYKQKNIIFQNVFNIIHLQCNDHHPLWSFPEQNIVVFSHYWVHTKHFIYLYPGAKAPGHQYPECWLNINPLREFIRQNINIYLHFMSFLHTDETQVVEIPAYFT